jgi:hypothetical protein
LISAALPAACKFRRRLRALSDFLSKSRGLHRRRKALLDFIRPAMVEYLRKELNILFAQVMNGVDPCRPFVFTILPKGGPGGRGPGTTSNADSQINPASKPALFF